MPIVPRTHALSAIDRARLVSTLRSTVTAASVLATLLLAHAATAQTPDVSRAGSAGAAAQPVSATAQVTAEGSIARDSAAAVEGAVLTPPTKEDTRTLVLLAVAVLLAVGGQFIAAQRVAAAASAETGEPRTRRRRSHHDRDARQPTEPGPVPG